MKKLISLLLILTVLMSSTFSISASAVYYNPRLEYDYSDYEDDEGYVEPEPNEETLYTSKDGKYKYAVIKVPAYMNQDSDSFCIFVKLLDTTATKFTIPDKIDGLKVECVYNNAFKGCTKLKNVKLGKYVRDLYYRAFKGCTSLTKINLKNVSEIRSECFANCSSLKSVDLANPDWTYVYVWEKAFYNCKNLKKVKIFDEVEICDKAFGYLKGDKKVKDFKMIVSTDDKWGDSESDMGGIEYCYKNDFRCIYNLNSKHTKNLILAPGNAGKMTVDHKTLTNWKSSNSKVAKIDSKGNFVMLKKGKTTFTAQRPNGKKYTKVVQIKRNPQLSINWVGLGNGEKRRVWILGKAKDFDIKCSTSKIAKVVFSKSSNVLKIQGLKKGKTTLTITVNGVSLKLKVEVY